MKYKATMAARRNGGGGPRAAMSRRNGVISAPTPIVKYVQKAPPHLERLVNNWWNQLELSEKLTKALTL